MFQLSLRSLLVLVTLIALAIVSLRFASEAWRTAVLTIVLVAFWAAVIVAAIDRGKQQAFAIGFVLTMIIYAATVLILPLAVYQFNNTNPEFNPATGRLPTTRLLNPLYTAVADVHWFDFFTGKEIRGFDPNKSGSNSGPQQLSLKEYPSRYVFAMIGHLWWALLLGFCGGWFAKWIYLRRIRQPDSLASGRS